jgi:hypothetical protein
VKARRWVAAVGALLASVLMSVLPAAADVPVTMVLSGSGNAYGTNPNTADWLYPECDPTQKTWYWWDGTYTNAEIDTVGSAYVGVVNVNATMTSVTPCAPLDQGTMTLTIINQACTPLCIGSNGNVNCSLSGSFLRVGAALTMLIGGSCTVNFRPPVAVQLQGEWHFLGTAEPVPLCGCSEWFPPPGPFEFTTTTVTG